MFDPDSDIGHVILEFLTLPQREYALHGDIGYVSHFPTQFDYGLVKSLFEAKQISTVNMVVCAINNQDSDFAIEVMRTSVRYDSDKVFHYACMHNDLKVIRFLLPPQRYINGFFKTNSTVVHSFFRSYQMVNTVYYTNALVAALDAKEYDVFVYLKELVDETNIRNVVDSYSDVMEDPKFVTLLAPYTSDEHLSNLVLTREIVESRCVHTNYKGSSTLLLTYDLSVLISYPHLQWNYQAIYNAALIREDHALMDHCLATTKCHESHVSTIRALAIANQFEKLKHFFIEGQFQQQPICNYAIQHNNVEMLKFAYEHGCCHYNLLRVTFDCCSSSICDYLQKVSYPPFIAPFISCGWWAYGGFDTANLDDVTHMRLICLLIREHNLHWFQALFYSCPHMERYQMLCVRMCMQEGALLILEWLYEKCGFFNTFQNQDVQDGVLQELNVFKPSPFLKQLARSCRRARFNEKPRRRLFCCWRS